jgi:hypothetical protein
MKNSLIDRANKNREHVCDISPEIRRAIAFARLKFSQLISAIRAGIKRLIDALNLDPSGEFSKTAELVKWVAEKIKYLSSLLSELLEARNELLEVARIIRAFIDFILSLPAKLLALLQECLANFLDSVKTGISDLLRETTTTLSGGIDETGISDLVGSIESIYKDTQSVVEQTADLLTTPAQFAAVLATPTTTFDQGQAASTVINFLSTNVANSETYTANVNPLFAISSSNPV